MVNVRLDQDWTDGDGVSHGAGETVDVDPGTLAQLEAIGTVATGGGADGGEIDTIGGSGGVGNRNIGPGTPDDDDVPEEPAVLGDGVVLQPMRNIGPGRADT